MLLPETIETPRLLLRKPLLEDASGVFESYAADPEVTRFLTWRPHSSMADALSAMLSRLSCWENGSEFSWILTRRDDAATILGMVSAIPDERHRWRWSLGYVLARPQWGRGYMTEGVRAVITTLFAEPGVQRVSAAVDVENFASSRVLEKAGMQREGVLKRWSLHPNISSIPRDCWSFAIVR